MADDNTGTGFAASPAIKSFNHEGHEGNPGIFVNLRILRGLRF
jgi:hypothetical protein